MTTGLLSSNGASVTSVVTYASYVNRMPPSNVTFVVNSTPDPSLHHFPYTSLVLTVRREAVPKPKMNPLFLTREELIQTNPWVLLTPHQ
jgi:hypothetical protein